MGPDYGLSWEYIKENKKKERKQALDRENDQEKRKDFLLFLFAFFCRERAFFPFFFFFPWSLSWSKACSLVFFYKFPSLTAQFAATNRSEWNLEIWKMINEKILELWFFLRLLPTWHVLVNRVFFTDLAYLKHTHKAKRKARNVTDLKARCQSVRDGWN